MKITMAKKPAKAVTKKNPRSCDRTDGFRLWLLPFTMPRVTLWVPLSQCSPPIVIHGGMTAGTATNIRLELRSMPRTRRNDLAELLRLALIGLDAQIAKLQETRAQLAALIDQQPARRAEKGARPRKRRKLSAAARAKISAAAKARWARERKTKAKSKSQNHQTRKRR
jgi:hypothetical protein